jgi:hypothetical protein
MRGAIKRPQKEGIVFTGISAIREKRKKKKKSGMTNHAAFVDKLRYHCPKVDVTVSLAKQKQEAPSKKKPD